MNKYELLEIIGEGAYGIVIKARSKDTNEFVAIKKFKEKDDQEDVKRCIYRELKMLKSLRASENIVTLKEAYRKRGNIYFVFEYVDRNMLQLLEENSQGLPVTICKNLIFQLCKALDWCHTNDIIHRDIKPENLLISNDGRLKLCDFGFARRVYGPNDNAPYTEYVATRWYRPPELLVACPYGKAVDIWAVGAILGELADGQPLFAGESDIDQLYVIQTVMGPLPTSLMDSLSKNPKFAKYKCPKLNESISLRNRYHSVLNENLIDFMERCLQMDPDKRCTVQDCLNHIVFKSISVLTPQQKPKSSKGVKKSLSFHHEAGQNRAKINAALKDENVKITIAEINQNTNSSNNKNNKNSNTRLLESSMTLASSRRDADLEQFEKTSKSELSYKYDDSNSDIQVTQLPKPFGINGHGYYNQNNTNKTESYSNFHNSSSSFLFKSKEYLSDETLNAFNKFSSKYSSNNHTTNKSPRDKVKLPQYAGQIHHEEEHSNGLRSSRQKYNANDTTIRNMPNIVSNSNSQLSKPYRSETKLDNIGSTKLPSFNKETTKLALKPYTRSKTSMDINNKDEQNSENEQERENEMQHRNSNNDTNENFITNSPASVKKNFKQMNSVNMAKMNNANLASNSNTSNKLTNNFTIPALQATNNKASKKSDFINSFQTEKQKTFFQAQSSVINHFDRNVNNSSVNGNSKKTTIAMLNGATLIGNGLLTLRNKK